MSQLSNEGLIRYLQSLGLAHPTTGRLLAGALIDPTTVVGASVQSTDNLLNSVSLDDEMLAPENRGLVIAAWGTLAANGNTKDLKLKVGSTAILTLTDSTANAKDYAFIAFLVRDGADSQRGFGIVLVDGAVVAASSINFTATEDANVAKTISTTADNNSAAASAATGKGLVVLPFGG
ncbi:MAG: hypothetical protein AB7O67_23195 [Vicinamibacterales bacterium]